MFENADREKLRALIASRVNIDPDTGCWVWSGSKNKFGYGQIYLRNGKTARSHRASFYAFNGPFNELLDVCHKCDNPPCCNPDHLFVGTAKDNVQDMINKGRFHIPDSATSNFAKLTPEKVVLAKEIFSQCDATYGQIAALFNVKKDAIRQAVIGDTWKKLSRPPEKGE